MNEFIIRSAKEQLVKNFCIHIRIQHKNVQIVQISMAASFVECFIISKNSVIELQHMFHIVSNSNYNFFGLFAPYQNPILSLHCTHREMEMFTYPDLDLDKVSIHLSEYLKTHFQLFTVFLPKKKNIMPLCLRAYTFLITFRWKNNQSNKELKRIGLTFYGI